MMKPKFFGQTYHGTTRLAEPGETKRLRIVDFDFEVFERCVFAYEYKPYPTKPLAKPSLVFKLRIAVSKALESLADWVYPS